MSEARPNAALVGAAWLGCFSAGLLLVWLSLGRVAEAEGELLAAPAEAESAPAATPAETGDADEAAEIAPTDETADVPGDPEPPVDTAPEDTPEIAPEIAMGPPSALSLERGRLAYIACPGLEERGGRCPRDREMEERVWSQILERAQACGLSAGTFDLRVHLDPAGNAVRFRDWGPQRIPVSELSRCFDPYAPQFTSRFSSRVEVSFRATLSAR